MRLSDIKGDRTIEVIADLIEPVGNIAQDPAVKALFAPEEGTQEEVKERLKGQLVEAVPGLLKAHKDDLVLILATLDGTTPAEYEAEMNLASTMKDLYELVTDEAFLAFLS